MQEGSAGRHPARMLIPAVAALMLTACAGTVVISDQFPDPVVTPMNYSVGIYYSPEFSEFLYEDEEGKLQFEVGSKQKALYDKVFGALFTETIPVPAAKADNSQYGVDMVLEPVLTEYAFLTPAETATNFYSVSMKYQIRLYGDDGTVIGYWPFVAYGKDRKQFTNNNESLGLATTTALRDAAAAIISQFRNVIESEQWRRPAAEEGVPAS